MHIMLTKEVYDLTDRNKHQNKDCSAVLGTLTQAQKAQKALSSAAIPTRISKSDASVSHRGCVWSVSFSCNQLPNVRSVLSAAGIKVKAWGDDDLP